MEGENEIQAPTTDEALAQAMDEGIASATPEPLPEEPAVPEPEMEAPAADPVPGTPEAAAAEAAKAEAAKAPEAPKPDADPAETEIASLGLKEKSAARFRELTGEVKALAPIKEALDKAGVKLEDLPKLTERAKTADELIGMVQQTGATPEQYGSALDYLALVNRASKGDLKAAEQAYDVMSKELQVLARALGREIPGVHDPLAEHADLQARVESGAIDRDVALELAKTRTQAAISQQAQTQQTEQAQNARRLESGAQAIAQIDAELSADPMYALRRPALSNIVAQIKATQPPEQWAQSTREAYRSLALIPVAAAPAAAAPPAKPPVGPVPLRPTGSKPGLAPKFDDPRAAMDFGISQAAGG